MLYLPISVQFVMKGGIWLCNIEENVNPLNSIRLNKSMDDKDKFPLQSIESNPSKLFVGGHQKQRYD